MHARSLLSLFSLLVPLAACGGGGDDSTNKVAPNVELFEASPASVDAGQSTTLRYKVTEAATVRIDVMGGDNVLPSSSMVEGQIATPTLEETTTFVLTATGFTGKNATASLTVLVNKEGGPQITMFSADPTSVAAGSNTTLSWTIEGADTGRIEVAGTTLFTIPSTTLASGTFEHMPAQTTVYTLVAVSAAGVESTANVTVTVTGTTPNIRSFRATPPTIDPGMSSDLSWEVADATQVTIADDAGNTVYSGTDLTGNTTVTPTATTRYTLTASDGTNQATQNVVVSVNVPAGAMIVSFAANPASILTGQPTMLEWQVTNAPGGIEISANGAPVTTSTEATGSYGIMPLTTTTYDLVAMNPAGNAMRSTTVTVTPPTGPTILTFAANPNPVAAGGMTTLSWTTLASTQVRVLQGGTELFNTTTNVAQGTFQVSPAVNTTYVLEASDGTQSSTARAYVFAHPAPTINAFTVTPTQISGSTPVTVAWDVSNYAQLMLTQDGAPVPGFAVPTSTAAAINNSGSLTVTVTQATLFQLTAISAGGTQMRQVQVGDGVVGQEMEPNDDFQTANPFDNGGLISGEISPAGEIDIFRIMVPQDGNVRAETSDGMGGCATDTVIGLFDDAGNLITADDNSGTSPCSLIDPVADPTAGNLPAGTYYVAVVHADQTAGVGTYVLNIRIAGPMCGNSIVETVEQCDFGDLNNGDGCSSTCQLEINPTVISGTGGNVTVNLTGPTSIAIIQVDVQEGQAISAIAADVGGTTCNSVDTALNLGDSNFLLLGGKQDGGPVGTAGNCASIDYPADAFGADLAAGSYYLVVFNEGTTNGQVQVSVTIQNAVCGNGLVESRTEQCDDGNLTPGDLCDATCNVEVTSTISLPNANPVSVTGALTTAPFANLIQINVTADTYVRVETFAPNQAGGCDNDDTVIDLYDGAFNFLGGDDEGGINSCSAFNEFAPWTRLSVGTYYLTIYDYLQDTPIPAYEVVFTSVSPGANPPTIEVEANDTQATANPTGLTGAGTRTVHGQIDPTGDDDVYSFVVPAGQTVMVSARTYDALGQPAACTPTTDLNDTRLFLETEGVEATAEGTGELAFNDDISATQWCSAIPPTAVTAGAQDATFYVRVQGYNDADTRYYFMDITVQ